MHKKFQCQIQKVRDYMEDQGIDEKTVLILLICNNWP